MDKTTGQSRHYKNEDRQNEEHWLSLGPGIFMVSTLHFVSPPKSVSDQTHNSPVAPASLKMAMLPTIMLK